MKKNSSIMLITALLISYAKFCYGQCFESEIADSDLKIDKVVQGFCEETDFKFIACFISYTYGTHVAHVVYRNDQSATSLVTNNYSLSQKKLQVEKPVFIKNEYAGIFDRLAENDSGAKEFFTSCTNTFRMDQPYLIRVLIRNNTSGVENVYEINSTCIDSLKENIAFQDLSAALEYLQIK